MSEPRKKSKKMNARTAAASNRADGAPKGERSVWPFDRQNVQWIGGSLLILALTFVAYLPALSAGFVWDDPQHFGPTRLHPTLNGLIDLWAGHRFYYPLTSTTFWFIRRIWDLEPLPYHLLNIILHGINSILLWRIVVRLKLPWPFLCGLIFALHPVHVQSVAWATELKNTQSGLFYLLSVHLFLLSEERSRFRLYGWSLIVFMAALLSKTSTVTLPFILLILHLWRGGSIDRKSISALAPYFGLSLAMGGMTVVFHQDQVSTLNYWDESLAERVLLACRGVWFYIQKFMWPATLVFVYPRWDLSSGTALWLTLAIFLAALMCLLWRGHRDADWRRSAMYGFAGFVASLLPVLNFFKMFYTRYSYVADHWQYLADMVAVPLAVALCSGCIASSSFKRGGSVASFSSRFTRLGYLWMSLVIVVLGTKTSIQCLDYLSMESLWRQSLRKNPTSYLARVNFGLLLTETGRLDEAYAQYESALPLDKDKTLPYLGMGRVEFIRDRFIEAERIYNKILETYPNDVDAMNGLAGIRVKHEQYGEAMELLDRASKTDPTHAETFTNRGRLLDAIGKREEAIAAYTRSIDLNPDDAKTRQHLGDDLRDLGRFDEALLQYSFSIQLDSKNVEAALALGTLLGRLGDFQQALEVFMSALEDNPANPGLNFNIGVTLKKLGRESESEPYFAEAARLDPQFANQAEPPVSDAQD